VEPAYVWKDEITGMTNPELVADWEKTTGTQYGMPVGCHSRLSWAVNALKNAADPTDKKSIADALRASKTDLITGHVDFTEPVDPNGNHLHPNVYHSATACPDRTGHQSTLRFRPHRRLQRALRSRL